MAEKIKLVQGDTRPQIKLTLTDATTGLPIDITGASCVLKFREAGVTTVLDTLTGLLLTPTAGVVVFNWNPTSLAVDAGDYEGEVQVTFQNGDIQSVYELLKFKVREDF